MSFASNKNFSRSHYLIDRKELTSSFLHSFEHGILSKISQRIPSIIQIVTNLCQILDDYPLTEGKIQEIQQYTIDCILWNDNRSYPIAIDQNTNLIPFRQSIRKLIHEFLEFTQEILIIYSKNNDINMMIQKSMNYLVLLNDYRTKRQSAYVYFYRNYRLEDALLVLINVDKQQFHQLRSIALYLRQFFLKLICLIRPILSILE